MEISVNLAITNFNDGKNSLTNIMSELGLIPGAQSILYAQNADKHRIAVAEKRALHNTLEARRAKRIQKRNRLR